MKIRDQYNKVKKFEQFSNDNKSFDSFKINIKYEVGQSDIDTKNILMSALQKLYNGWKNIVILDWYSDQKIKNSAIELRLIDSKYDDETYEVIYNQYREDDEELDSEEDVINYVESAIKKITYYTYRSQYSMDKKQKTDIKILSFTKL